MNQKQRKYKKQKNLLHAFTIIAVLVLFVLIAYLVRSNKEIPDIEHDPKQSLTAIITPEPTSGVVTDTPFSPAPTKAEADPTSTAEPDSSPTPTTSPTPTLTPTATPIPSPTPQLLSEALSNGTGIVWADDAHTTLYFGAYPQSEIAEADLPAAVINASFDTNGDAVVDGVAYRRLSVDMINYNYYADNTTLVKNYYDWSTGGYRYFKYEPIKWKVLENTGTELLVITDEALDCKSYNEEVAYVTWETSSIRSWLNGYDEHFNDCELDYSWRNASFLSLAFSDAERALINYTRLTGNENVDYPSITGGSETVDRIFFLSLNDITNPAYGYSSKIMDYDQHRIVTSSTYAKARGLYTYYAANSICHGAPSWYWLRTPGMDLNYTAVISNIALALTNGLDVNQPDAAILPAMRISLTGSSNEAEYTHTNSEAPVFTGVHDRTVEVGKPIAYKKGVLVTDNKDGELSFTVESSTVNYRAAGSYTVTYTATDSDGNTTTETAVFTVANPVNLEEKVDTLLNQVIDRIITADMTKVEKAYAIFKYVKNHVGYIGTSNKENSLQDAYIGLQNGIGDCYTTYNVAKRLLDKVGIDNLGIERLRRANDSRHYWLMINCGDGWYYFDAGYFATSYPFDGFMFTESERIDYCNLRGKNGFYYRYDTSLYDVTPVQ